MVAIMNILAGTFGDKASMVLGLMVFLAAGTLAFSIMVAIRVRASVKKRTSRILDETSRNPNSRRSLRYSSRRAAQRLLEYTTKHYSTSDNQQSTKVLRRRLMQAGIFESSAVAKFFLIRTALAIGLAVGIFFVLPMIRPLSNTTFWLAVIVAGIVGYVGPSMYIDKRIKARRQEHREGFPDFMDLLVVCADSGLPIEAALERVGREFSTSYPSLTANIHMTNLEIRAGRTLPDALDRFADRVGLEEVRAFVTLISQSLELGSNITQALRVYSDDMRHKRLSRAEEKAYALPAKLSLPMMICIFPVLFVVILLPVFVRLHTGNF
jgi:tight adherence protein C